MKAPRSLFPQLSLIATWSLAACSPATDRPAPTATSTPIWTASASPSPSPTPRSSETHIRSPIPTANTTPAPVTHRPAEPVPVVLSQAEAEQRVLAWFLPEQAARVAAVTYVSSVDFWEAVDRLGGDEVMRPGTGLWTTTGWIANSADAADQVMALVEVEAGPPRRLAPDYSHGPSWTTLPWDDGQVEGGRRRIAYLFNAGTGASLGSPYLGDDHTVHGADAGGHRRAVLAALRERPIRVAVGSPVPMTATPTPTAWPTDAVTWTPVPTSRSIPDLQGENCLPTGDRPLRLAPDAVPAPLAATVRWLPYVEGATWTYERTVGFNEAQWTRGQRQETVLDRWRLAEDAMLIRLRTAMTVTPLAEVGGLGLRDEGGEPSDRWLVVLPGATYEGCRVPLQRLRDVLAEGDFKEHPVNWLGWDFLLEPRALGDDLAATDLRAEATQDLPTAWTLPVGQFHGCRRYGLPTKDAKPVRKGYLCPNLGWMARAEWHSAHWFSTSDTEVLTRYRIPRWHTIP